MYHYLFPNISMTVFTLSEYLIKYFTDFYIIELSLHGGAYQSMPKIGQDFRPFQPYLYKKTLSEHTSVRASS